MASKRITPGKDRAQPQAPPLPLPIVPESDMVRTIVVSDPRIVAFYAAHPHIQFTQVNLGMIDLFEAAERPISSAASVVDSDAALRTQILSELHDYRAQSSATLDLVQSLRDSVSALTRGTEAADLAHRESLSKIKEDYIREMGLVVANGSLATNEKLGTIIDRNAVHLADRTAVLLAEQLPKHTSCVQDHLKLLAASIHDQIQKTQTGSALPEFLAAFDQKYTEVLQSALTQTEMRLNSALAQVKSDTLQTVVAQTQLGASVDDFLQKYGNSSTKGKLGEANLASVLTRLYPAAECENTSGTPNSGDFRLTRGPGLPPILFETKDYLANVDKSEIQKFIRDAETQGMHGVFLSQSSGIAYKQNFQIEFDGGRILVYVHCCEYSPDKIKAAVDIIDSLAPKLLLLGFGAADSVAGQGNCVVPRETMDAINIEYNLFLGQKESIHTIVKDFAKKISKQVDTLQFFTLDKLLSGQYATAKHAHYTCDTCGVFHAKTKQSLSAHKRACK